MPQLNRALGGKANGGGDSWGPSLPAPYAVGVARCVSASLSPFQEHHPSDIARLVRSRKVVLLILLIVGAVLGAPKSQLPVVVLQVSVVQALASVQSAAVWHSWQFGIAGFAQMPSLHWSLVQA
jgi:hypothetical protein